MGKIVSILFAVLVLVACGSNNDENRSSADGEKDTMPLKTDGQEVSGSNYYKRLEGKIAGQDVVAHLSKFNDKTFLNYYYVAQGVPIGLFINHEITLQGDSIEFVEYDCLRKVYDQEQDNKWHVVINANGVKGKWISGDGKKIHDINLKENYPAGSHLFNVVGVEDSLQTIVKNDSVRAYSYMMLMEPSDAAVGGWYKNTLLKTFSGNGETFTGSIPQFLENETKDYLRDYKQEIDSAKAGIAADTTNDMTYHWLNYANELNANALYNDDQFLVMNIGSYSYTGGAHGIEGRTVICYDMREKKEMTLPDVISADSVSLQKIVEKSFRENSGLNVGQSLKEILFENKLPANDNFYFTNKGMGFIYQPYEVAAYAMGIIYVFIPYTDLKPYLNPQFAQRIGLQ